MMGSQVETTGALPCHNGSVTYNLQKVNSTSATDTTGSLYFNGLGAIITTFASIVISITIIGNILVIAAVCTEPKLRKVGNYFLVSLGVSDLLVGVLVTPLSLASDLSGEWEFGQQVCYFWTSMDIMCCTASIVNLCVISFDRFNAITDPLRYAMKRTPCRAAVMITFVWFYSALIAIPPMIGWRKEVYTASHRNCQITLNKVYTVISIAGSYVLPLILMLCLYGKVFSATLNRKKTWLPGTELKSPVYGKAYRKHGRVSVFVNFTDSMKRYREQGKAQEAEMNAKAKADKKPDVNYELIKQKAQIPMAKFDSSSDTSNERRSGSYSSADSIPRVLTVEKGSENTRKLQGDQIQPKEKVTPVKRPNCLSPSLLRPLYLTTSRSPGGDASTGTSCDGPSDLYSDTNSTGTTNTSSFVPSPKQRQRRFRKTRSKHQNQNDKPKKQFSNTLSLPNAFEGGKSSSATSITDSGLSDLDVSSTFRSDVPSPTPSEKATIASLVQQLRPYKARRRKATISLSQERRAAKTLGIIMGCFILCWFPFFTVALLKAFCRPNLFPPLLFRFVTWLGYFNSALNPIIYTFFNQDFRAAFKRIVCFS